MGKPSRFATKCEAGYSWLDIANAGGRVFGTPCNVCTSAPCRHECGSTCQSSDLWYYEVYADDPQGGKVREIFYKDWVCRENDLTRCTNWRPNVSIYGGFERSINWYLENNLL